jgi:hypothetical protein
MTSGEFVEKLNHSNPSWDNPAYFGDLEFTSWAGNYLTGPLFSPVSLAVLGPIYHHNVDSKTIHADQVELALKNGVSVPEHVLSSVVRPVKYHEFDFAHLIGKRYRSHDGHDWEVVGQSSTHIPYVRKVVRDKATGKTFFCDYQSWYRLYFGEPEKISTGDVRVNPMVNVHPLAIEARKRYRDDLKAGHTAATEYWRGQAGAFFTGNPLDSHNPYVSGYPSRYPVEGDIVRFAGYGHTVGPVLHRDEYGTVVHVSRDGEKVMVYWGEDAMEAKPIESSKLVLVSRSGGQNPIMETIGTAAITGIGLGAGFKMVDGLVNKAKSVIKNPRTLPPLMRGTMEKTYDCGCVMSGTTGRTQFCATARGLLGQQAKARKAYKRASTLENRERLTRADLAFEKHYHFRRTSA